MVLETLQKGAPVNVKSLSIESPSSPGKKFKLERDIPGFVRDEVILEARLFRVQQLGSSVAQYLYDAKFLFPQELQGTSFSSSQVEAILIDRIARVQAFQVPNYNLAPAIKALSASGDNPFSIEDHEKMAQYYRIQVEGSDSSIFEVLDLLDNDKALALKMNAPEKIANLNPSGEFLENISFYLGDDITAWSFPLSELSARIAASLRILFWPDTPPFVPQEKHWQIMQAKLKEDCDAQINRPESTRDLVRLAKSMQILAADELRITENGLETIFRDNPDFQQTSLPLPESRRF